MTVECHVTDFGVATAEGGCSTPEVTFTDFILPGDCPHNYTIVRTFFATDNCGNITSLAQTITVQDTTSPEFNSVPEDYTIECSEKITYAEATATDNCGEVTITIENVTTAGSCTGDYTITRTFAAVDGHGNENGATQTITVVDTTAPELTIPAIIQQSVLMNTQWMKLQLLTTVELLQSL